MQKMMFNWRYWALTIIGFIAFICLVGVPADNDPHYWMIMIMSKLIGAILTAVDCLLYIWFEDNGEIDGIDFLAKED